MGGEGGVFFDVILNDVIYEQPLMRLQKMPIFGPLGGLYIYLFIYIRGHILKGDNLISKSNFLKSPTKN